MKLFEIDENMEVKLNKPWIMLIPEFEAIYRRDKGSRGDSSGKLKRQARREFSYIYFYNDFNSPIRDWEDTERHKEALYYAGLENIDSVIEIASKKYQELAMKAARSLRTYRALLKMLDAMDTYFENLDMEKVSTRTGELVNSPDKVASTVQKMDKMYDSIKSFARRVEEELKEGGTGIRGTAVKGENEDKVSDWSEADIAAGSVNISQDGKHTEVGAGGPNSNGQTMDSLMRLIHIKNPKNITIKTPEEE